MSIFNGCKSVVTMLLAYAWILQQSGLYPTLAHFFKNEIALGLVESQFILLTGHFLEEASRDQNQAKGNDDSASNLIPQKLDQYNED